MISGADALRRLQGGNQRFVSNQSKRVANLNQERRTGLTGHQEPHAIILGCSDSRVPAEIIFDQDLGDLFVIRVAGNIAGPSQIGSVEFAAENFGTRLVVVLGHSRCGAVIATLEELEHPSANPSSNLRAIVECITPAVSPLLESGLRHNHDELLKSAVRENIRTTAKSLRERSPILEHLVTNDGLLIVSAEYSLETGVVDFFDGL